jgi:RNA polymerase sigma-70 factor (family 1)
VERERDMSNLDETKVVGVITLSEDASLGGRNPMAPPESGSSPTADAALVHGLQSDDPDTLRQLMDAYWAPLVGFAHRILAGAGDAEDNVQTAFVRLWSRRRELEQAGSLRSLLYTIVRNSCLDELRKRDRREKAQEGAIPPPSPKTPYEDVQGAELQRLAAAAVAHLPKRRGEVFRLAREEGLSYQEIAEIMGLSPQTVANHMSLAMADLRTALRPYFSDRSASTNDAEDTGPDREQMDG